MQTLSSWKAYDLTNVDPAGEGYFGAVFDGTYVTFVPLRHLTNQTNGPVIRYDSMGGTFDTPSTWSVYDTKTNVDATVAGFAGGAFDGQYLYLVPLQGSAARFDTKQPFNSAASWRWYATTNVDAMVASLEFGGFDGRYVYYGTGSDTMVARVDTTQTFDDKASWGTFDTATLVPACDRLNGMIFDGRYMYFPPGTTTDVTARFDTKSPASMPSLPGFSGSFD
jgi:hypothetical protein